MIVLCANRSMMIHHYGVDDSQPKPHARYLGRKIRFKKPCLVFIGNAVTGIRDFNTNQLVRRIMGKGNRDLPF